MTQLHRSIKQTKPRIIAAIPCLNEGQFVRDIVTRTRRYVDKVIVVDDGSTDNTSEAAQAAGAHVIRHERKKGAGAATRSAFAMAKTYDADVLITLDGDGQHDPDEIPQVLAPILRGEADLVIGSRFLLKSYKKAPRYRKLGIDLITWLYNFGSKFRVSDSQSCFRAHTLRLVEAVDITENGFSFSVQVLIQARQKGFLIKEVPVSCIYHSESSSLNPMAHGLAVAWGVVKLRFRDELLTLRRRKKDELKE